MAAGVDFTEQKYLSRSYIFFSMNWQLNDFRNVYYLILVSLQPHNSVGPPCCYYRLQLY
jgi:hypothetical protein